MAHIVALRQRDSVHPACILPAEAVGDIDSLRQSIRHYNHANTPSGYINQQYDLYLDDVCETLDWKSSWRDTTFSLADWLCAAGALASATLLMMFVSLWLAFVLLVAPAALVASRVRRARALSRHSTARVASLLTHPRALLPNKPDPMLVWALKMNVFYTYPECNFVHSWESVVNWPEYDQLTPLRRISLEIRGGISGERLDVAKVKRSHPTIYKRIVDQHSEQRNAAFRHFNFTQWSVNQGIYLFAAVDAIREDSDIVAAYRVVQDIDLARKQLGAENADADLRAELMQKVGLRVQRILDEVRGKQLQELEVQSAGAHAVAAQLFIEQ